MHSSQSSHERQRSLTFIAVRCGYYCICLDLARLRRRKCNNIYHEKCVFDFVVISESAHMYQQPKCTFFAFIHFSLYSYDIILKSRITSGRKIILLYFYTLLMVVMIMLMLMMVYAVLFLRAKPLLYRPKRLTWVLFCSQFSESLNSRQTDRPLMTHTLLYS